MKKILAISALSVIAVGAVAVGIQQKRPPANATSADLERDLSLANAVQATRTGVVSVIEQTGGGAPSAGSEGVRALVVTKKPALSAAHSRKIAEVAASPTNERPLASDAPTATLPPQAVAATPEPVAKAPLPEPIGAAGAVAVGGPSAGGVGEGDRGVATRGAGGTGIDTDIHIRTGGAPLVPPTTIAGVINSVVLRGGNAGVDHCEPPRPTAKNPAVGTIGAVGTVILNGGAMPRGSVPGGNRAAGRRW